MTAAEKVEWAKRAFKEIARECEDVACLDLVTPEEKCAWRSVASTARRNIRILEQP